MSDMLFHYTTIEGLKGILNTNELWATDFKRLNDSSEIHYAKIFIKKHLEEHLESEEDIPSQDISGIADIITESPYKAAGDNYFILS